MAGPVRGAAAARARGPAQVRAAAADQRADRAAVVALACQLPAETGVPLSRWTGPELAAELTAEHLAGAPMSVSSLPRILAENPVKPWQYQSWIYPRDPDFAAKATVILDLYQGFHQGEPLRPGDRILSFDAKPSIQARGRIQATLPAGLDVHIGQVFASTPKTTGIAPFADLAGQVMARPEYKDAPRVFVKPFNWKYTATDLKALLHRISEHEKADAARQTDLARAA